jgi:hypothetical protein
MFFALSLVGVLASGELQPCTFLLGVLHASGLGPEASCLCVLIVFLWYIVGFIYLGRAGLMLA